jgi:hypothetical protein
LPLLRDSRGRSCEESLGGRARWLMPIEVGVWRINDTLERVQFSSIEIDSELGRRGCSVVEAKGVHNG